MILSHINEIMAIGGALVAFLAFWWRLSSYAQKYISALGQLENNQIRLEGAVETSRKTNEDLIRAVDRLDGKVEALFRTLQSLYPERIPKRASDRP